MQDQTAFRWGFVRYFDGRACDSIIFNRPKFGESAHAGYKAAERFRKNKPSPTMITNDNALDMTGDCFEKFQD